MPTLRGSLGHKNKEKKRKKVSMLLEDKVFHLLEVCLMYV